MEKQTWAQRNKEKCSQAYKRYYQKNKADALIRSKKQNLRGKYAYELLTEQQKRLVEKKIDKFIDTWIYHELILL